MDALRQICGFYFLAPTTCQIGALHSNRVTEAKKYNMMPQQVEAGTTSPCGFGGLMELCTRFFEDHCPLR